MHKMLLDLPSVLETERLLLRCYQPGDGAMYYQAGLRNREHLQRFESGNPLLNLHSAEEGEILIRELAAEWAARNCFFWGAFEKSSGAFAAQVYVGPVSWDTPEFEVGYIADVDHQGKGYVTEAVKAVLGSVFQDLHAHRVSIHCSEENPRSQRVAERCGFVLEGRNRENHRAPDGHLENSLHYGLLRTDL
jgi:RimJ/RimL family protein N-acetyltransferase